MLVLVLLLAALLLLIVAGLFAAGSHIERSEKLVSIVISVVGSLLTFVGLVFAGLQIRAGAQQLEASSIYAMQKDGREIFEKSMANTAYVDFVFHFSANKTYDASTKEFARRQIGLIIQFYSSIYNQYKYGVLSHEAWEVARQDLCMFIRIEPVRMIWNDHLAPKYPSDFVEVVKPCLN